MMWRLMSIFAAGKAAMTFISGLAGACQLTYSFARDNLEMMSICAWMAAPRSHRVERNRRHHSQLSTPASGSFTAQRNRYASWRPQTPHLEIGSPFGRVERTTPYTLSIRRTPTPVQSEYRQPKAFGRSGC